MLNDEKVCDLFHKEYRAECAETESLYKRYQFAVAAIALLAGVVSAVTRRDLLPAYWTRVDVFLYYTFVGLAGLLLVCAAGCLVVSIKPRRFQNLDGLVSWQAWRRSYREELVQSEYGQTDGADVDSVIAKATCDHLIDRIAEATDWNAARNRVKLRWFNFSFYFTVAAIAVISLQAAMHAIIFLNGVRVP